MKENMYYGADHVIFERARELRNQMTPAEEMLWKHLHINKWKIKFRRQHPISTYIADFYCHKLKLVIELDGNIHEVESVKVNDLEREGNLKRMGLTVLRFRNDEVLNDIASVLHKISSVMNTNKDTPLGDGGRDGGRTELFIIKIGGNIIDDDRKLAEFLAAFAALPARKILVHGGGKLATKLADSMGVEQKLIDGRRITDAETLKIVTMVYAGYVNKNIVAKLQSLNSNAVGLCGADGDAILAHKRKHPVIDYGYVGDIDAVNTRLIQGLLEQNLDIVFAPITHDQQGQLLNTNADTIAQEIAKSMSDLYDVSLVYSFEKSGVLLDAEDDSTVIRELNPSYYQQLRTKQKIFAGMLPKLDNAFAALNSGVKRVVIGKAEQLEELTLGKAGTTIIND